MFQQGLFTRMKKFNTTGINSQRMFYLTWCVIISKNVQFNSVRIAQGNHNSRNISTENQIKSFFVVSLMYIKCFLKTFLKVHVLFVSCQCKGYEKKERKKKEKHVHFFFFNVTYRLQESMMGWEGVGESNAINVCQYRCQSRFLHTCRGDP